METPVGNPLLVTPTGNRVVATVVVVGKGHLVLIPPPDLGRMAEDLKQQEPESEDKNVVQELTAVAEDVSEQAEGEPDEDEYVWTPEDLRVGSEFVTNLVEIDEALRSGQRRTPPPVWASAPQYRFLAEETLERLIRERQVAIESAQREVQGLQQQLEKEAELRGLLFETGGPLEAAIIEALKVLGYTAEGLQENDSEFDVVFVSPEGTRLLGEAEGKNDKSIAIDKVDQLDRNVREDFARQGESAKYAHGVLFGNAFRLTEPEQRGDSFTEKCVISAQRSKFALVRTPDLFRVAKYLKAKPDPNLQKQCRQAIESTEGAVVQFPSVPGDAQPIEDSSLSTVHRGVM